MIKKVRKLSCCHSVPAHIQYVCRLLRISCCCHFQGHGVIYAGRWSLRPAGGEGGFRFWGPPNLQFSGYRGSIPGVKPPEREVDH
jgi:hypothetical protein